MRDNEEGEDLLFSRSLLYTAPSFSIFSDLFFVFAEKREKSIERKQKETPPLAFPPKTTNPIRNKVVLSIKTLDRSLFTSIRNTLFEINPTLT